MRKAQQPKTATPRLAVIGHKGYRYMTRDKFKLIHSELIMQVQCIEHDLKLIYAGMHKGNFDRNLDALEKVNLGTMIKKVKELDYSDGHPDLTKRDYALLEQIREIRNYWCHQCFIDYVYIADDYVRERKFQELAIRLSEDENRTWELHQHLQQLRNKTLEQYNRI